jgi:hypothetical protein
MLILFTGTFSMIVATGGMIMARLVMRIFLGLHQ